MNRITDNPQQNFLDRPSSPDIPKAPLGHHSTNAEDKFMHHFENINKNHLLYQPSPYQSQNDKFATTLQQYSEKNSQIDLIIGLHSLDPVIPHCDNLVPTPLVPHLNESSYEEIKTIQDIFEGK